MPPPHEAPSRTGGADLAAVRGELEARFPCRSWRCDEDAEDGSVAFRCDCGAMTGRYPSYEEGSHALGVHLDEVQEARAAFFETWVQARDPGAGVVVRVQDPERRPYEHIADRIRRRPVATPTRLMGDFPRVTGPGVTKAEPGPQFGLAHLLLYRLALVGVVSTRLPALAEYLGLRVERSFGEAEDCDIAYFEHEDDAFALVRWEPTQNVEVCAYVPRGADGTGVEQLERFLELARLSWDDVVHPSR